jgi:hypothetical protein
MISVTQLLDKTHPTYLRRLAKEIRRAVARMGVYYHQAGMTQNARVTNVLFSGGRLHIKSHLWDGWRGVENVDGFFDGNGTHISASRQA